jgi:hypothetical protein
MSAVRLGSSRGRLARLGSVMSQCVNVLLFDGSPSESLSGMAHREGWSRTERIIDIVFFWESDHCAAAHHEDIAFARAILNARQD